MKPKLSIIIPIYNSERYLKDCLESILCNNISPEDSYEIICINDGSTDKTKDILDNYASKEDRITVYHKINEGAAIARSYGVSKASGDYVMFVDSDDTIISNAVSSMVKIILEDRNVDIVVSGFNIIKNNKTKMYNYTLNICNIVSRVHFMNATAFETSIMDIYNQLDMMDQGLLPKSWRIEKEYCTHRSRRFSAKRKPHTKSAHR